MFKFFIDVILDLLFIGIGVLIYYQFLIHPLIPVDLHPLIIQIFGGNRWLAVAVISAVFFTSGVMGIFRSIRTAVRSAKSSSVKQ